MKPATASADDGAFSVQNSIFRPEGISIRFRPENRVFEFARWARKIAILDALATQFHAKSGLAVRKQDVSFEHQNKPFASKSCIGYPKDMKHIKPIAITARINPKVKKLADRFCASQGLIMSRFIEEAILDKLEEVADSSEVAKLRKEPVRSFNQVIKELKFLN